jgi:hypothetical protein
MSHKVIPQVGRYVVYTVEAGGIHTQQVSKDKCCTCGGTATHPCAHIHAVADYLRQGGRPAPEKGEPTAPLHCVQEESKDLPPSTAPLAPPPCCPDLRREITMRVPWSGGAAPRRGTIGAGGGAEWRAGLPDRPHPNKQGAVYEQTVEEREAFLRQDSPAPSRRWVYPLRLKGALHASSQPWYMYQSRCTRRCHRTRLIRHSQSAGCVVTHCLRECQPSVPCLRAGATREMGGLRAEQEQVRHPA